MTIQYTNLTSNANALIRQANPVLDSTSLEKLHANKDKPLTTAQVEKALGMAGSWTPNRSVSVVRRAANYSVTSTFAAPSYTAATSLTLNTADAANTTSTLYKTYVSKGDLAGLEQRNKSDVDLMKKGVAVAEYAGKNLPVVVTQVFVNNTNPPSVRLSGSYLATPFDVQINFQKGWETELTNALKRVKNTG